MASHARKKRRAMKRRVMKVLVPKHSVGKKARSEQSKRVETAAMGVEE